MRPYKKLVFSSMLLFLTGCAYCQSGCTDAQALNYDPSASVNDGSCLYASTSLSLVIKSTLASPVLDECSGLCIVNGRLWVQADNTDHNLYCIDSLTGAVIDSVNILSANNDWEDLTAGNDYMYIGDFGNNWGNRTNLRILKIPSASLDTSDEVIPEEITFSYADQTGFATALNNNSFDCEALLFLNDSLHLFTRDWINKITRHYIIPSVPGNYSVMPVDSFDVDGLVSSAAISPDGILALTCYNSTSVLPVFMWMFSDYPSGSFFSGNKRRLEMGSMTASGQVEGVDFAGMHDGYVTNERFQQLIFNVPPQLKSFDLNPYLPLATGLLHHSAGDISVHPNPTTSDLYFDGDYFPSVSIIIIIDSAGRIVLKQPMSSKIDIGMLAPGFYTATVTSPHSMPVRICFIKT